jgi:hypothetical protein
VGHLPARAGPAHPYLTERMLARTPLLAQVGHCASLHHEQLDGSGYPHRLLGEAISRPARILGAADVYNALRQSRPHRPALEAGHAERTMRDEVRAGRLDGDAVQAVLEVPGHRVRRRAGLPSGLTAREAGPSTAPPPGTPRRSRVPAARGNQRRPRPGPKSGPGRGLQADHAAALAGRGVSHERIRSTQAGPAREAPRSTSGVSNPIGSRRGSGSISSSPAAANSPIRPRWRTPAASRPSSECWT